MATDQNKPQKKVERYESGRKKYSDRDKLDKKYNQAVTTTRVRKNSFVEFGKLCDQAGISRIQVLDTLLIEFVKKAKDEKGLREWYSEIN